MGRKRKDKEDKYYIDPTVFRDEICRCIDKYTEEIEKDAPNKESEVKLIAEESKLSLRDAEKRYRQYIKNKCLSRLALTMLLLLVDKTMDKMFYAKHEDKEDCRSYAVKDIISYWPNFDIEKGFNAFAFYSSIIFTGAAKGLRHLYPDKYKGTISMDAGSGNSGQGIYTI